VKFAAPLALVLLPACGPSLTTVHEGSVRFEHCYRLDLESSATRQQRNDCWSLWLASYTYGQSRDRIDYARRRVASLAGEDPNPPTLRVGDQRVEQRQFYLVVPAPSSVHATPPPIATVYDPAPAGGADAGSDAAESTKSPPEEGCAAKCKRAWESCDAECSTDAGASSACACGKSYGKCMRGCFD
jgi:hypothetical protein